MQLETCTPDAPDPIEPGRFVGAVTLDDIRFSYPAVPGRPDDDGTRGAREGGERKARPPARPPEALRGVDLRVVPVLDGGPCR